MKNDNDNLCPLRIKLGIAREMAMIAENGNGKLVDDLSYCALNRCKIPVCNNSADSFSNDLPSGIVEGEVNVAVDPAHASFFGSLAKACELTYCSWYGTLRKTRVTIRTTCKREVVARYVREDLCCCTRKSTVA